MTDLAESPTTAGQHPLTPSLWRIVGRRVETVDVVTLALSPENGPTFEDGPPLEFRHGQFNMLTAFGVGEVAISVSSAPGSAGPIEHSIRDVGAVTHALCNLPLGALIGLRGPFGTGWDADEGLADGTDVVVVAGGIGMAPLRGTIRDLVERRAGARFASSCWWAPGHPTRSSSTTTSLPGGRPESR